MATNVNDKILNTLSMYHQTEEQKIANEYVNTDTFTTRINEITDAIDLIDDTDTMVFTDTFVAATNKLQSDIDVNKTDIQTLYDIVDTDTEITQAQINAIVYGTNGGGGSDEGGGEENTDPENP